MKSGEQMSVYTRMGEREDAHLGIWEIRKDSIFYKSILY